MIDSDDDDAPPAASHSYAASMRPGAGGKGSAAENTGSEPMYLLVPATPQLKDLLSRFMAVTNGQDVAALPTVPAGTAGVSAGAGAMPRGGGTSGSATSSPGAARRDAAAAAAEAARADAAEAAAAAAATDTALTAVRSEYANPDFVACVTEHGSALRSLYAAFAAEPTASAEGAVTASQPQLHVDGLLDMLSDAGILRTADRPAVGRMRVNLHEVLAVLQRLIGNAQGVGPALPVGFSQFVATLLTLSLMATTREGSDKVRAGSCALRPLLDTHLLPFAASITPSST